MTTTSGKQAAPLHERRRTRDEVCYAEPGSSLTAAIPFVLIILSIAATVLLGPSWGVPELPGMLPLGTAGLALLGLLLWMRRGADRVEATLDLRNRILRLSYVSLFRPAEERVFFARDVLAVELIPGAPSRLVLRLTCNEPFQVDSGSSRPPLEAFGTEIARVLDRPFRRSEPPA